MTYEVHRVDYDDAKLQQHLNELVSQGARLHTIIHRPPVQLMGLADVRFVPGYHEGYLVISEHGHKKSGRDATSNDLSEIAAETEANLRRGL